MFLFSKINKFMTKISFKNLDDEIINMYNIYNINL